MTKVFIVSSTSYCEGCETTDLNIETEDWIDLDDTELKKLENSIKILNRRYSKYYTILYKENVVDIHKNAKEFLKKLEKEKAEKLKKAQIAKEKKANSALERKKKQLEKLKKELGE